MRSAPSRPCGLVHMASGPGFSQEFNQKFPSILSIAAFECEDKNLDISEGLLVKCQQGPLDHSVKKPKIPYQNTPNSSGTGESKE